MKYKVVLIVDPEFDVEADNEDDAFDKASEQFQEMVEDDNGLVLNLVSPMTIKSYNQVE